jgi:prevent-host-death family protein
MYINATDLKNKLGEFLDACLNDDIIITRHGKEIAVLKGIKGDRFLQEDSVAYDYSDRKHSIGRMSYQEFKEFTAKTEERYELIDGNVYLLSSPKVNHQYALTQICRQFFRYFEGKKCVPFFAPFDITLNNHKKNPDVVQPDLSVICDLNEYMNENGYYMGTPSLVLEILSETTKRKDMVTKLNLYMCSGVKEYWIVNCENKEISIFRFEDENIIENKTFLAGMVCKSFIFSGLQVDMDGLFL